MATGNSRKSTKRKAGGHTSGNKRTEHRQTVYEEPLDSKIVHEITLILLFALCIFLFLCNLGLIGKVGSLVSNVQFGIFGLMAYAMPILIPIGYSFYLANIESMAAIRRLISAVALCILLSMIFELMAGRVTKMTQFQAFTFYADAAKNHDGGGFFVGMLTYLLYHYLSMVGTVLFLVVAILISLVVLTGKAFLEKAKDGGKHLADTALEGNERRKILAEKRREEMAFRREEERARRQKEKEEREAMEDAEKVLRMDKKTRGVPLYPSLEKEDSRSGGFKEDMHEITVQDIDLDSADYQDAYPYARELPMEELHPKTEPQAAPVKKNISAPNHVPEAEIRSKQEQTFSSENKPVNHGEYRFPPISLLQQAKKKSAGNGNHELQDTAERLKQTLQTFGVRVTVTDISQGPSVTRFELQPEQGVKVSKIVGLADDIKLNLAATDIRIEAPIPGKAAVGIEVPNKENSPVSFRELVESKEYQGFQSKLTFAVGKDIAGKVIVTDIAKMPHMLIAGATGSGKSVCINTIIMSILFKSHPDDVKLILVDPKVVELSVYNGIPHLLVPVVTDPKKAAGALHWGVAEMTDRYNKFAEMNVRDIKGYNQKAEEMRKEGAGDAPANLPQILIVVDELADLMMVASNEVEESICRLAQLARAAGIHLIIATQRPSVDVITGLIKANMPSRVAFAVSSQVDSRTILDMAGAEKLLGKGDMLFYPQGYPKPARIQGAFVSDKEVQDTVNYIKDQNVISSYSTDIEEKIKQIPKSDGAGGMDAGSAFDEYFVEAGKFIIEKDKASIGMLQRVFKIGFNRAARIMDQLCDAGVVGEEEGTKPRKVLMSMEQFESFVEESV